MLKDVEARLDRYSDWGVLAIRLAIGMRLIQGTQDNVFSDARMEEFARFLAANGMPWPMFSAHLSAYAQFICGCLIVVGLLTRPAGLVIAINFVFALIIAHRATPFEVTWPALMMLCAGIYLLLSGAGRLSLDAILDRRTR